MVSDFLKICFVMNTEMQGIKKKYTPQQKRNPRKNPRVKEGEMEGIRTCCWRYVSLQRGPPIKTR